MAQRHAGGDEDITMKIYVGKIASHVTESDLRNAFEAYGTVESTDIIKDKSTGAGRGFGFVVMPDGAQARKAIEALNDKPIAGQPVAVNEAKLKAPRTA
jgi:RNA recognition motif-containing protein